MSAQQDEPGAAVKAAGLVGYGGLAAVVAFLSGIRPAWSMRTTGAGHVVVIHMEPFRYLGLGLL